MEQKNILDRVARLEGSLLGCLVEFCSRGSAKELDGLIASGMTIDQFKIGDHCRIFRAMAELRGEGKIPDQVSLIGKLDDRLMAKVCDFPLGVVPENLASYVRDLRKAWQDLCFSNQQEELTGLANWEEQLACVERMRQTLLGE